MHDDAENQDRPELEETLAPMDEPDEIELSFNDSIMETNRFEEENPTTPGVQDSSEPEVEQDKIPGFRIITELGRGAFGVVFQAEDVNLDRLVAIKLPLLRDSKLAAKYIQEARNAAQIDAPGIVPVYQVGTTRGGQPFVVQKFIDGSSLSELLKGSGKLSAAKAIEYVYKIAKAIGGAHQSGLVHRDLKPANILLDQQDELWVADFGLAVFEEDQRELRGEVAGTPAYMAPEQLTGRVDWLDGRADIWAIGIIFYQLLTGRLPFESENFDELRDQIQRRPARPISQRMPGLPSKLDEVFARCCAKKVDDRYASARELAADLEELALDPQLALLATAEMAGSAAGPTLRSRGGASMSTRFGNSLWQSTQLRRTSDTKTGRWLTWIVLAMALGGVAGFGLLWSRLSRDTQSAPEVPAQADADPPAEVESVEEDLRVSKAGTGSHSTIADAIAEAAPDSEIVVQAGTYTETLVIDKPLRLRGEGAREEISIVGEQAPAIQITAGGKLTLINLSLDAKGEQLNTIEVQQGSLTLNGCRLKSTSFDCIKLDQGSQLQATDCDFQSAEHPAIFAAQAQQVDVSRSSFQFDLPNLGIERDQPVAGIQLAECGANIRECTFNGIDDLGKGVSARDAKAKISIAGCKFTGLLHATEFFDCQDVELTGLNVISGCELGCYVEGGQVAIQDADIKNCDYGLSLVESASVTSTNAKFDNNSRVGIWLENSRLELDSCFINDNQTVGILIDVEQSAPSLTANSCSLQGNQIGALLVSGAVEFELGLISQNRAAGVAVVSHSSLPDALRRRSVDEDSVQRVLRAKRVTLNGKSEAPAVLFNAPGAYLLSDCPFVDFPNDNRPAVSDGLTTEVRDGTTWVIRR